MESDIRSQLEKEVKTAEEVEEGMKSTGGGLAMVMDITWAKADGGEPTKEPPQP